MMRLIQTDIDQLLDATMDIADDFQPQANSYIEIDKLLDETRDW
ncbi:hypothetical protein [Cytobacillus spongiae]|jgi:hypothetical protein|nr:hypothetical protein [Cytobacillus spongiae]